MVPPAVWYSYASLILIPTPFYHPFLPHLPPSFRTQLIQDTLILPYLDIDLKDYDLSIENREATKDKVTIDAAHATRKYNVAGTNLGQQPRVRVPICLPLTNVPPPLSLSSLLIYAYVHIVIHNSQVRHHHP